MSAAGAPIFWGVMMAFFALLPLGAWIIWGPVAVWLLLTGDAGRGITLLIVGAGGISLVDNFLRPILLAGQTQMNGLLVFVSLLGGLLGIGMGYALSGAAERFLSWPTSIPPEAIAMAFGFAAITGVFFGFYPAMKASRLDPIEALRFE